MKLGRQVLSVAAGLLVLSVSARAQAPVVQFNGVGSSAVFLEFLGAAAALLSPANPTHVWYKGNGAKFRDARPGLDDPAHDEAGNIGVVWDDASPSNVYAFLQTDSTVGVRLFLATTAGGAHAARLLLPTAVGHDSNPGLEVATSLTIEDLPEAIRAALDTKVFNAGVTDIRPEDAKFATIRTLGACGSTASDLTYGRYKGMGYFNANPGDPIGLPIGSDFSSSTFTPVDFQVSGGHDPITDGVVPSYVTTTVGAQAVVVALNKSVAGTGHFGDAAFANVTHGRLAGFLTGSLTRTTDMLGGSVPTDPGAKVLLREPLSGTYNTMEWDILLSQSLSQEDGNCNGTRVNLNPLHVVGSNGYERRRVVGNGQMLTQLGATGDRLGYFFYSVGNAANVSSTTKYVTVDGVDPLQASYVDGSYPDPVAAPATFDHVIDGTYPIWNQIRVVSSVADQPTIASLVNSITTNNFVPYGSLSVFRSHVHYTFKDGSRPNLNVPANNGNGAAPIGLAGCSTAAETGGDAGGKAIRLVPDEADFCAAGNPNGLVDMFGSF